MALTRQQVQDIVRATVGRRVYLNGMSDKMYWSDYADRDDRDDPKGGPFFTSPVKALKAVLDAVHFLIDPESGEFMVIKYKTIKRNAGT